VAIETRIETGASWGSDGQALQAWRPVIVWCRQPRLFDTVEGMKKPLKCLLMFHEWRLRTNDEGQQYKICDRCGAYRDFTPAAGAS
jgi:hypothetical protein